MSTALGTEMPPYFRRTVSSRGAAFSTAVTSTWTGFSPVRSWTISNPSLTMFIAEGVRSATFKTKTPAAEALADQLTGAANYDVSTAAINKKEETERVAAAAR